MPQDGAQELFFCKRVARDCGTGSLIPPAYDHVDTIEAGFGDPALQRKSRGRRHPAAPAAGHLTPAPARGNSHYSEFWLLSPAS
jgi:hypothetical protein